MAVPSSGQLRLRGDIALEVYGTATGSNISLRAMSNEAGFNVPDSMSEFYGYSSQTVPSVTTNAMSVGETTANLSGNVTSDGQSTITERGFYFGTNSASPTNNTKYVVSGTTGSFTNNRTGLTTTTTYYCWAYATNALGTTYGARVQATTLAVFAPTYQGYQSSNNAYLFLQISNIYGGTLDSVHRLQYLNPNTSSWIQYQSYSSSNYGYSGLSLDQNQFGYNICTNATNRMYANVNQTAGAGPGGIQYFSWSYYAGTPTFKNVSRSTNITPLTGSGLNGGSRLSGYFDWTTDYVTFPQPNNQFYQFTFDYN